VKNLLGLSSRSGLLVASIAGLSLVLTVIITQPSGAAGQVKAGNDASVTYRSPRTVTYKSELKTAEAEQKAADSVTAVNRSDLTASSQQDSKAATSFAGIAAQRSSAEPAESRTAGIRAIVPTLTGEEAAALLNMPEPEWQEVQNQVRGTLSQLQTGKLSTSELSQADQLVAGRLPETLGPGVRLPAIALTANLLIPNYVEDTEATEAARNKARSAVEPVSYTVERDQVIASRGQMLSDFDVERLTAIGLTRPTFSSQRTLGIFLLVLLFSTLLLAVAPNFVVGRINLKRTIALLGIFAVGLTLSATVVVPTQPILAYVLPVAAPVLLLALFYGFTLAILAAVCFSALYALAAGGSFELFFIHLAAATAAVLFSGRVSSTGGFLRAGALTALVVFVGTTAFSLLAANFDAANLPKFAVAAGLNGALTATFVFAGAAFLGNLIGATTFLQLLELESPRQPLLRRLANEMPNTYSHSLRIARLVEAAAGRVGADPLLARVQALYHDIGKLALSDYFIENQHGTNPHAELETKESAEILRAHISEGLVLAYEAGLPEVVSAAIPEHHGTFLMPYFWEQAKQRYKRPNQSDYRYFGPKPQSKETALLMLADATEAASRSLESPGVEDVQRLIQSLITERIDDGQLDQAPLTTYDLKIVKQAYAEVIISDLHKRIRYPKPSHAKAS